MNSRKIITTYPDLSSACQRVTNSGLENIISVGARPSGSIHVGNLVAIANSFIIARKIGSHLSSVDFTICNLDMPDMMDWEIGKKPFTKYFAQIPHPNGNGSLLDVARKDLELALCEFSKRSGVGYDVGLFSDIQKKIEFREGLKKIIEQKKKKVPIYPICPSCRTGRTSFLSPDDVSQERVFCENPECKVQEYRFDVSDTNTDLSVHFGIDPIRDVLFGKNTSFHVFGRDYLDEDKTLRRGGKHITKIDRVSEYSQLVAGDSSQQPYYFLTPMIYAADGSKMSKSRNNGLDLGQLVKKKDGLKRLFDFAEEIADINMSHVDYSFVHNRLLN